MKETLIIFDDIATMGTESGIQTYRNKLITDISTVYTQYAEANSLIRIWSYIYYLVLLHFLVGYAHEY